MTILDNKSQPHVIHHLTPFTNYTVELRQRPQGLRVLWSPKASVHFSTSMAGNHLQLRLLKY